MPWKALAVGKFVESVLPGDVGVAGGIRDDVLREVVTAAAEVSGIDERRAGGVNLRDEAVAVGAAAERGLDGVGRGEVRRDGRPGDVSVARRVYRETEGGIETVAAAAAEVSRVDDAPSRPR